MSILEEMVQRITELELRLDNLVQPAQAYHYQPITTVKGWNPATDEASQTLDLQAAPWSLPAGIKAVSAYLGYTAANNNNYGLLEITNATGPALLARCPDANEEGHGSGIVNCDSSGDIYFRTNNATNTVALYINGYFI